MSQVHATIARHGFTLRSADVERKLRNTLPEPLDDHYVVVGGRRFPPKQVISVVTGLDRADFNTHQARRILGRLGFAVGRRERPASLYRTSSPPREHAKRATEADLLRPFLGQWVAQRGMDVIVAASTPQAVLEWLEQHQQVADAMFRVPREEHEAAGAAPA